jgi:hypothetical protein
MLCILRLSTKYALNFNKYLLILHLQTKFIFPSGNSKIKPKEKFRLILIRYNTTPTNRACAYSSGTKSANKFFEMQNNNRYIYDIQSWSFLFQKARQKKSERAKVASRKKSWLGTD